tara:strand:+ start:404 stop:955 length:552 start_codon:yes stop_codon:yes gene_type:complete
MNKYCIGLLIIGFIYLCFKRDVKEGLKIPPRHVSADLQDIIKSNKFGDMDMTQPKPVSSGGMSKLLNRRSNVSAEGARRNIKECSDTDKYHSCNIDFRKPPGLDPRYINLPTDILNTSDVYNHLSICPKTYQSNMDILQKKQTMGQYSGYSRNGYIDRTRYFESKEPMPVNPDFFMDGGGTYA